MKKKIVFGWDLLPSCNIIPVVFITVDLLLIKTPPHEGGGRLFIFNTFERGRLIEMGGFFNLAKTMVSVLSD